MTPSPAQGLLRPSAGAGVDVVVGGTGAASATFVAGDDSASPALGFAPLEPVSTDRRRRHRAGLRRRVRDGRRCRRRVVRRCGAEGIEHPQRDDENGGDGGSHHSAPRPRGAWDASIVAISIVARECSVRIRGDRCLRKIRPRQDLCRFNICGHNRLRRYVGDRAGKRLVQFHRGLEAIDGLLRERARQDVIHPRRQIRLAGRAPSPARP